MSEKEEGVIRTRIALVRHNFQLALQTSEPLDKAIKAFDKMMGKYAEKKR